MADAGRPVSVAALVDGLWGTVRRRTRTGPSGRTCPGCGGRCCDGTFTPAHYVVPEFGYNQGWRVEQHPRLVADITGDQRADIVGFANNGVYTVTSHGHGSFELPVTVQVPDLRGLTATGAASALQAAGLVLGSQGIAIDYTCLNIGRVIRQSPVTGTTVNVGTPVAIWIGRRSPLACP